MIYSFTTDEIDFVRQHSEFQYKVKRSNTKIVDKSFFKGAEKSIETAAMGLLGEFAACKFIGGKPDLAIHGGGGAEYDAIWLGKTWQIKTSVIRKLIFNDLNDFATFGAILVHLLTPRSEIFVDPKFHVLGGISKTRFIKTFYNYDFGNGNRVVCDYTDLTALDHIERLLTDGI